MSDRMRPEDVPAEIVEAFDEAWVERMHHTTEVDYMQDAIRHALAAVWDRIVAAGDGYHTMDELYRYRMLYNAHAAAAWLANGWPVVKSWKHADGEECFGGGWFIVTATLPTGQVSNHYEAEHWDLFSVPEVDLPPVWDGHTPADAAERIEEAARLHTAVALVSAPAPAPDVVLREYAAGVLKGLAAEAAAMGARDVEPVLNTYLARMLRIRAELVRRGNQ